MKVICKITKKECVGYEKCGIGVLLHGLYCPYMEIREGAFKVNIKVPKTKKR